MRTKPVLDAPDQGFVAHIRPVRLRLHAAHQSDTGLKLSGRIGPGQGPQSVGRDRVGQGGRDVGGIGSDRAVAQDQRAQPAAAARQHGAGHRIEAAFGLFGDPCFQGRRQGVRVQPRRQHDAGRGFHLQRRHRQQPGICEPVGLGQPRAAAAGQPEGAGFAAALGDPVGEGGGEQAAGIAVAAHIGRHAHTPAVLPGGTPDARQSRSVGVRIAVLDGGQAGHDIGGVILTAHGIAFLQQRRDIGCARGFPRGFRRQHHRREPGVRPNRRHALAGRGDAALGVHRTEVGQQRVGRGERAGWRRILKRQVRWRRAPSGTIQREGGQFGLQNLRPVEGEQAAMQGRGPEADGHTRCLPPRAAGALIGGGAGDSHCCQPGQAGRGVQPRRPSPAAVHHDAHTGNGQGGFGDRRRENDPPRVRRCQCPVLVGARQLPMQWENKGAAAVECGLGAPDLRHARQEGEDIPLMLS